MKAYRVKGPRLGTKLMFLGLTMLVVPWFSYRQIVVMERLLIQAESQNQIRHATTVSSLFNGRDELFRDLPVNVEDFENLFAYPLEQPVRLDGDLADWGDTAESRLLSFGSPDADGSFELILGERAGQLYGFVRVNDPQTIYRDRSKLRLDLADHLRLKFIGADAEDELIALTITESGPFTAYQMDPEWRFAANGDPDTRVQGVAQTTDDGLVFEFRLPIDVVGSRRYFGITYVDIDDIETRAIANFTQTLPTDGSEGFNLVVFRSPEALSIIEGLRYSGTAITVLDNQRRVRARTGNMDLSEPVTSGDDLGGVVDRAFASIRPVVHRVITGETLPDSEEPEDAERIVGEVIASTLEGEPIALRRRTAGHEVIVAGNPIVSKDQILGAVIVEQNTDEILSFQQQALRQVVLLSVVSLFAIFVALLAFAGRLAWRIRKLRREASAAIDQYGRLRASTLYRENNAGDEIGDLSRAVSGMLSKLAQHNQFLETMPRTLRHEINNPLNTLSTSLQNLELEIPEIKDSKYLDSAKRGVMRIGAIVQNLADAASLEESLESEEKERIDLNQLLGNYVNNCALTHSSCKFVYKGPKEPVMADVADYRIEQMLDKIIDNAIDFHRSNSPIRVQLDTVRDYLQITVANRGPTLPDDSTATLFDSMVSHRGPQNRLHFGLGLYVVRIIAEYHGGFVRAMNLTDGSGVAVLIQLPKARTEANSDKEAISNRTSGESLRAIR